MLAAATRVLAWSKSRVPTDLARLYSVQGFAVLRCSGSISMGAAERTWELPEVAALFGSADTMSKNASGYSCWTAHSAEPDPLNSTTWQQLVLTGTCALVAGLADWWLGLVEAVCLVGASDHDFPLCR